MGGFTPARFVAADRIGVGQRQADLVQATDQAILAEGVDLEGKPRPVRGDHRLRGQIDAQAVSRVGGRLTEQPFHRVRGQDHRQKTVLEAVIEEDVGKTGGDHRAQAVVVQRPDRVLTRGPAAEVFPRQQDLGAPVLRLVEDEVRVGAAARHRHVEITRVEIAPVVEQVLAKASA
jgi:hypothetical protein